MVAHATFDFILLRAQLPFGPSAAYCDGATSDERRRVVVPAGATAGPPPATEVRLCSRGLILTPLTGTAFAAILGRRRAKPIHEWALRGPPRDTQLLLFAPHDGAGDQAMQSFCNWLARRRRRR
jgi:hypothetical protein